MGVRPAKLAILLAILVGLLTPSALAAPAPSAPGAHAPHPNGWPYIIISPGRGGINTQILIIGFNYGHSETVTITWGPYSAGYVLGTTTTTSGGGLSTKVVVPQALPGYYPVCAHGMTSNDENCQGFNMAPVLYSTPGIGTPGSLAVLNGTGFYPNETVNLTFDSYGIGKVSCDSHGSFSWKQFVVPPVYTGNHGIIGTGNVSKAWGYYDFYTYGIIQAIPVIGNPGSLVAITGTNFLTNTALNLYWGPPASNQILAQPTTDATGSFTAQITIPSTARPGPYTINVTFQNQKLTVQAYTGFVVSASNQPQIALPITQGAPGPAQIPVQGVNFAANAKVTLTWGSVLTSAQIAQATTNASGFFKVLVPRPTSVQDPWQITATDGNENPVTATYAIIYPKTAFDLATNFGNYSNTKKHVIQVVDGGGFAPLEQVLVTLNGVGMMYVKTDSLGNLPQKGLAMTLKPGAKIGSYVVRLQGQSSTAAAQQVYSIETFNPQISLLPTFGRASSPPVGNPLITGTTSIVSGSGFAPFDFVNVIVDWGTGKSPVLGTIYTGQDGSFTGLHFTIPYIPVTSGAQVTATATGLMSQASASSPFFVLPPPQVSYAPQSGGPTTTFYVSLTQFSTFDSLTVYWYDPVLSATIVLSSGISTGDSGNLNNLPFTIPAGQVPGGIKHIIIEAPKTGVTVDMLFTVPPGQMTLTPSSGPVSSKFVIVGSGWGARERVTITWPQGKAVVYGFCDSNGNFSTSMGVPIVVPGPYVITGVGGSTTLTGTATFTVTS